MVLQTLSIYFLVLLLQSTNTFNLFTGNNSGGTNVFNLFTNNSSATAGTIKIGTGTSAAHAISLGSAAAGNMTLTVSSANTLALRASVGTINVGNEAFADTINIGNNSGGTLTIAMGTAINVQGAVGATITLGATAQTGLITLGSSSATSTVTIAAGAGTNTVSINNASSNANASVVNILAGAYSGGRPYINDYGRYRLLRHSRGRYSWRCKYNRQSKLYAI